MITEKKAIKYVQKRCNMAIKNFGMKPIHSFLADGIYYIPDYQREYSWDKDDHLVALWEDINSALNAKRNHFFGQVVIHESEDGKNYIIDGQQRTCTSVILLAALRDIFADYADDNEEAQNIKEDIRIKYIGRWTSKKNELRLHIGVADREYFKDNIQKKSPSSDPKTPSQKRIKEAYEYFKKQFLGVIENIEDDDEKVNILIEYYEVFINKFNLMAIETDDMNEAFIIFETLNARGKDLESSDLLKNYIFMQSGANIESVKNKWVSMIDLLDRKEDTTKMIRYYWNSKRDFVREKSLYKKISSEIKAATCEKFVSDLLVVAELYNGLVNPEDNKYFSDSEMTDILINLSIMKTATFYPIIIAMVLNEYEDKDIKNVLKAIEILAFRNFVVSGLTANKYEVYFAKVAKQISDDKISSKEIIDILTQETIDDEKFKRNLIGLEVKTVPTAKYILREIEDFNSQEKQTNKNNQIINLEHIMPKNNNQWKVDIEFHKKYLYRLANQTLLLEEYNKSISNKIFEIKKDVYSKSKINMTKALCSVEVWDSKAIQERENKLNEVIVKRWALLN